MEKEELIRLFETTVNIYTDESSHMDDGSTTMVLGATWMSAELAKELADKVKLIKVRNEIPVRREIKWTKVGANKLDYYKELIDLFVSTVGINFRAVVVDKSKLDHDRFNHTRDDFYYIMQYYLVRNIIEKCLGKTRIYLDYKDTWSGKRSQELSKYLSNTGKLIGKDISAQPIRSHESIALQLADLMSGAVMYANKERDDGSSVAKLELVRHIESRIGQKLNQETPYAVEKFNLFIWKSR
jgi:hypothetical protein